MCHNQNIKKLTTKPTKKGYVKGNITVISNKANRIKNNGTAEEHEAIAKWLRDQETS